MIFVTQENDIKLGDKGIQVIYFYDSRVPTHRHMIYCIEQWEKEHSNESLAIDLEYFANQSKRFDIKTLPSFIIFKNGYEFGRIEGTATNGIFTDSLGDICIPEPLNGDKNDQRK